MRAEANTKLEKDYSKGQEYGGRIYGWHWGNRGSVSSAAIEKPHRSGWRPILEGEFDLAYSPLMELNYGKGLAIWCALDVEGRDQTDPVGDILTRRVLNYASGAKIEPRTDNAVYLGGPSGEALLKLVGLKYEKGASIPGKPALLIVGADYGVDEAAMKAFLTAGGKALFLARTAGTLPLGFKAKTQKDFGGYLSVPTWPECRGLSESDLHLRVEVSAPMLSSGPGKIGAKGLLGRLKVGLGVAVFMQLVPDMLNAKKNTYMRFSTWRVTRTIAQLLSNLGGTFEMDGRGLKSLQPGPSQKVEFYCPGYRTDFKLGDEPYRYKRW